MVGSVQQQFKTSEYLITSMYGKRIILTLLVLTFVSTPVYAVQERFTAVDNIINFGESATFSLELENPDNQAHTYTLSLNVDDSSTWIASPSNIQVGAGETKDVTVRLTPRATTRSGSYFVRLRLTGEGETKTLAAPISLGSGGERDFVPNVGLSVTHPDAVDPREQFQLGVEFRNRNRRVLNNLTAEVQSEVFYSTFNFDLDSRAREGRNLFLNIQEDVPPGEYRLRVNVYMEGGETPISSFDSSFNVVSYSNVEEQQEQNNSLFKDEYRVELTNNGNAPEVYTYDVPASFFERLFISASSPAETVTANGETVKRWTFNLAPGETATFTYQENYRGLVYTIIAVMIGTALYFYLRSPVVVTKEATVVERRGAPGKVKVHLYIRNRSRNKVFNIALNDTVPSLLSYKENTSIGYLSPSQVKQRKKGKTRLNWDIQSLDPLEERILVYEAEPRLEVLGQVDLPSAQASFEDSEGNTRTYESNAPNAGEDTTYLAGREK